MATGERRHTIHTRARGVVHVARAEDVYPSIPDGSVTLGIVDGPYNMRKAPWDCFKTWADFVAFYRPHVEAWTRVCAASATVYVWGTDDSASELRPLMREYGWEKRVRVTWDKVASPAAIGWGGATCWLDSTEACDVYTRGRPTFNTEASPAFNVWRLDLQNGIRSERVWSGDVVRDPRRSKDATPWMTKVSLHPCQKPLIFYTRQIMASSRPGDTVLEPFGGTLRSMVAIDMLPASEARRYIVIEPDATYVDAVLAHEAARPLGLW